MVVQKRIQSKEERHRKRRRRKSTHYRRRVLLHSESLHAVRDAGCWGGQTARVGFQLLKPDVTSSTDAFATSAAIQIVVVDVYDNGMFGV